MNKVISQYWSEGIDPTQLELFDDTEKDFETMKRKIKGKINRTAKIIDQKGFAVEMYEDDVLVETRELPGKSISYAENTAENWVSGLIVHHYLDKGGL
tara:strand:+ start:374 stop:667 length:294 start_codon:yes stop_codon:yes gene_type:complete